MLLGNGINYIGKYQFQQVAPPTMTGTRSRSGVSNARVRFGGATPLTSAFLAKIRAIKIPQIEDYGQFGVFGSPSILAKLFNGYSVDDGRVWTYVDLNFEVPVTDKPTSSRENRTDESWSWQTVRVKGPGESYYEALYISPQSIHNKTHASEPGGPDSSFKAKGSIQIVKSTLHTDPEAPPADLTPIQSTRVTQYESREVIPGQLWESTSVVSKILEDDDRS